MKIVFMGTPRAAVRTLKRILDDGHEVVGVYTQPDKPAGRGQKFGISAVKEFAAERGLRLLQPTKIRTADALAEFRSLDADVAVVVAYGRILPETFLTAFPLGAINVHFSLLPKYRGAAPVNWAIVNGESETGVTTMQMDAGLDTGDILLQESTLIGRNENAVELMDRLAPMGATLLSRTLDELGTLQARKQDGSLATYAPVMSRGDGLIDWSMTAVNIANRVRGFQPFPTAFTTLAGKRLTVWNAAPCERTGNAGELLEVSRESIVVGCGDMALEIHELQLEGKKRLPVREFLNGTRLTVGDRLGQ